MVGFHENGDRAQQKNSEVQAQVILCLHMLCMYHFETMELTCLALDLLADSQGYLQNKPSLNNTHLGHFEARQKQNVLFGNFRILQFILLLAFLASFYMLKTTIKKKTEAFFFLPDFFIYLLFLKKISSHQVQVSKCNNFYPKIISERNF